MPQYKLVYVPSAYVNNLGSNVGGINQSQSDALVARKTDLTRYINEQVRRVVATAELWFGV